MNQNRGLRLFWFGMKRGKWKVGASHPLRKNAVKRAKMGEYI